MNIAKSKLKQFIAEEYSNLLEEDPLAGGMTGHEAEWSVDPYPEEEPEKMGFEGDVVEVEPKLNLYSMGMPGSEGGPPIATFEEGNSFKDTLANMIAEELYESYDHLDEGKPGQKMMMGGGKGGKGSNTFYHPGGGMSIRSSDGTYSDVYHKDKKGRWRTESGYAGQNKTLQAPAIKPGGYTSDGYYIPRPGQKGYAQVRTRHTRSRPNWGAIGAGLGGLALGGMAGYMAGGGGQGTGGRQRTRPHPYRRDQGARHMAPQYAGTRYGPPRPRGAPYPMREPTRMPRGYGGGMAMSDAQDLYDAMKGGGTDEDLIWDVLNANLNPRKMMSLWDAYGRVLQMEDDLDDGNLIDWLEDDGMDGAARAVKMLMNGQAVPYELARKWADDDA